jgi:AcrR family transcriptional regulator
MTMGQLLRARSAAAKETRRAAILAAARAIHDQTGYAAIAMADVARRARLAKGTVFLYFPTKEALFLALSDALVDEWLDTLHAAVAGEGDALSSEQLATLITGTLAERAALRRLLPLVAAAIEPNAPPEQLAESRRRRLRRHFATGALVEERLRLSRPGDGVLLLRCVFGLLVGLGADPELPAALTILANGFHRRGE